MSTTASDASDSDVPSRRGFLVLAGAASCASVLAACGSPQRVRLPEAEWGGAQTTSPSTGERSRPQPLPRVVEPPLPFPGVRRRSEWARGEPDVGLMNPMLPVRYITIHHDGLDRLETGTSDGEMRSRIDLYRVGHRAKGWGDIGYHFVVDRAGVVWEGRNLRWQGAHVKDRNEGNIGVLVMGNFEIQRPTNAQLAALRTHLRALTTYYSVPWNRVFSHKEWPGAQTLCPGVHLQSEFVAIRSAERV
jgi:hypothetical protein